MDITPGEITSQAYANQVKLNNAIEYELISIGDRKPCACSSYTPPSIYNINR